MQTRHSSRAAMGEDIFDAPFEHSLQTQTVCVCVCNQGFIITKEKGGNIVRCENMQMRTRTKGDGGAQRNRNDGELKGW